MTLANFQMPVKESKVKWTEPWFTFVSSEGVSIWKSKQKQQFNNKICLLSMNMVYVCECLNVMTHISTWVVCYFRLKLKNVFCSQAYPRTTKKRKESNWEIAKRWQRNEDQKREAETNIRFFTIQLQYSSLEICSC